MRDSVPSPAALLGHTSCGAVMKLPYVYEQVLSFLGVLAFFGAIGGAIYAAAKGGLR